MGSPLCRLSLRGATRRSNPFFLRRKMDCFASLAMTASKWCSHPSDFAAGTRDGLARDGAGAFAAEPEHGISDFRGCHEPSLRIVLRQFSHGLLAAAAGLLDDVVDRAFQQVGFGEAGTDGVDGDAALRGFQ